MIVSRLPDDRLERRRARQAAQTTAVRSRRVAASRRTSGEAEETSKGRTTKEAADSTESAGGESVDDVNDSESSGDAEAAQDTGSDEETESGRDGVG